MSRIAKTSAQKIEDTPGRAPFIKAFDLIQAGTDRTFEAVEPIFLEAMQKFDALVVADKTEQGDRQNGKGDFFNDVLALLLERGSGEKLHSRGKIPGLMFQNHSLDVAWPKNGRVELTIETKATGTPKHGRATRQKDRGRDGSADLEKRLKEAAFKGIDIKGQYARELGQGGGATADLASWLRTTPPRNYLLMSVGVTSPTDLARTISFAHAAGNWFDRCGLYAYGHQDWDLTAPYEAKPVDLSIQLDRVMHQVTTALVSLAASARDGATGNRR